MSGSETSGSRRVRLNEQAIQLLMPLSEFPDVVATAFTLYTKIPQEMLSKYPLGNPESFIEFVEKNPKTAQEIIRVAKGKGLFD